MKKSFFSFFPALFLLASLAVFPVFAEEKPLLLDGIAAEVGGVRITIADVMDEAKDMAFFMQKKKTVPELYAVALTNLIDRQLILQKYEQAPQKLPEWYLKRRAESIINEKFNGNKTDLVKMLDSRGISYDTWLKKIEADTIIGTMRSQFVERDINIGPEQLREVYDRDYAGKKLEGPVRVAMILLESDKGRTNALHAANHLVAQLRNGKVDFESVARHVSKDPHAREGGDWGYINPDDELRSDLAAAVNKLKKGEISDPIAIDEKRIYIIRKLDEQDDLSIPYEYVRAEIEGQLHEEVSAKRFKGWVKSLAKEMTIRLYPSPFDR